VCKNCRFSKPDIDGVHFRCCFNPPTVVPSITSDTNIRTGNSTIEAGVGTGWPIVAKDDWCGKYDGRVIL
jgi:hypothetical protein